MHLKSCALTATATLLLSIPAAAQTPAPATKPKSTTSTAAKPAAATYDRALLKPALLKDKAPDTYQVKFVTENRDHVSSEFTVTVTRGWAPLGADRFYNLVKHHYFDNSRFFRVIPNFMVQFGISAYPPVNTAWGTATIKDDPVTQKNVRGMVTFAKTVQPNSRSTQIFVNFKDNTFLDSQGFAPFGVVDGKGINVVEMMYDQYGDTANDEEEMAKGGEKTIAAKWPKLDTIKSATLIGAAATTPAKPAAKPAASAKPAARPAATTPKPQQ